MNGGPMTSHVVAHGKKSDPNDDGYATLFGNVPESNRSSVGFYQVSETYFGAHGESIRLDGLSDTNSNVRERVIVLHDAPYVKNGNAKQGRSLGCFVLSEAEKPAVLLKVKNGSVLYAMN
jgi:hypothetical protein